MSALRCLVRVGVSIGFSVGIFFFGWEFFAPSVAFSMPSSTSSHQTWVFQKNWVRNTMKKPTYNTTFNRMSPVFYKNLVIQGNGVDGIVAYNEQTGHLVWRKDILGGVPGGAAIFKDSVYFSGSDGFFYSLDAKTGKKNWSFKVGSAGFSTPSINDDMIYFQSSAHIIYALDLKTGQKKWIYVRNDSSPYSILGSSSPTISGGKVFVGFSDGYLVSLNKKTGSLVWEKKLNRQPKFRDVDAKPLVHKGHIYIGGFDDKFYKLQASTGEVIWEMGHGTYSHAFIHDKSVYVSSSDGAVLALDSATGRIQWKRNLLKGNLPTSATSFSQFILIGTSKQGLLLLDKLTGQIQGQFSPGWGLIAQPKVKNQNIYFISNGGNLFSLQLKKTKEALSLW